MHAIPRTFLTILAALALRLPAGAAPAPDRVRVEAELRAGGMAAEPAARLAEILDAAARDALPMEPLRNRLQEGLAKHAPPEAIRAALLARAGALKRAMQMLHAATYDENAEPSHRDLLLAAALALESGVAADDVAGVLQRGGGTSALRIQTAIEAGESLHLAGLDHDTVRTLMFDCLERNLRRMEMLRATRFTIQQHREGTSGGDIRRRLWGGHEAGDPLGCAPGEGGPGNGRGGPGGGPMGPPARTGSRAGEAQARTVGATQGAGGADPMPAAGRATPAAVPRIGQTDGPSPATGQAGNPGSGGAPVSGGAGAPSGSGSPGGAGGQRDTGGANPRGSR